MRRLAADRSVSGEAFWRFSLAFYARPGVADALIALQERAGLDVNLILFGLWLGGNEAGLLSAGDLARVEAAIAALGRAVIAPLRRLRRQLKPESDPDLQALRRRIAALELDAERRAQHRVARALSGVSGEHPEGDRLAIARANLALVLGGEASSSEAAILCQAFGALARRN